jgi:hypothetical protein
MSKMLGKGSRRTRPRVSTRHRSALHVRLRPTRPGFPGQTRTRRRPRRQTVLRRRPDHQGRDSSSTPTSTDTKPSDPPSHRRCSTPPQTPGTALSPLLPGTAPRSARRGLRHLRPPSLSWPSGSPCQDSRQQPWPQFWLLDHAVHQQMVDSAGNVPFRRPEFLRRVLPVPRPRTGCRGSDDGQRRVHNGDRRSRHG